MTLGNKIKEIRKKFGLSQEELAEKLNVSRQAITKWENDNGLPDTENLKQLSSMFGITIDYLLNNQHELPLLSIKEKIDLNDYDKCKYKDKYQANLRAKYPEPWKIYSVMRKRVLNPLESIFDFFIGAGTVQFADALGDMSPYFLVCKDNINLLVNISNDYLEAIELPKNFNGRTCKIGKNKFIKLNIQI